jgi:glycosidase
MVWEDMTYADEVLNRDGSKKKSPDKVAFNRDLFNHYRKLVHIRRAHEALQLGDYRCLLTDGEKGLFGFQRVYKDEIMVVLLNNSEKEQKATFRLPHGGSYADLLNDGVPLRTCADGTVTVSLKPMSGAILLKSR